MNIETFPAATSKPDQRPVRRDLRLVRIGEAWELRLVAEAYDRLAPGHLIVSDGLAHLSERLLHGSADRFLFLPVDDYDECDVFIASFLLDDLRDGCELLADAIADDQRSAHPRILESAAGHVLATCRRIRAPA